MTVDAATARHFLTELANFFDYRLTENRMVYYLDALVEMDGSKVDEVFQHLIRHCSRWPSLREILDAFKALEPTTYEVKRSLPPSPASEAHSMAAWQAEQEFEPVHRHLDLYWEYVRALQEYRMGRRTREELNRFRQDIIRQAREREKAPQAAVVPVAVPTGG